jgi:hypothetical protein
MQASQHGTTGAEIGDYPGALLKNSRPARPPLQGALPASGRLFRLASPAGGNVVPQARVPPASAPLSKYGRNARAASKLWLNQLATADTIANATVLANVSEYFLGLGKSGCLIHCRRLGRGGRWLSILARKFASIGLCNGLN